jgi:hypothetical protein
MKVDSEFEMSLGLFLNRDQGCKDDVDDCLVVVYAKSSAASICLKQNHGILLQTTIQAIRTSLNPGSDNNCKLFLSQIRILFRRFFWSLLLRRLKREVSNLPKRQLKFNRKNWGSRSR